MRNKAIIGVLILIIFSVFAFHSFRSALNPYVAFAEASQTGRNVQVMGTLVDTKQIGYDIQSGKLHFYLADEEGTVALVVYDGAMPDNFDHADSVVIMGRFLDGAFHADRLMVKCPSKYVEEGEDSP